MFKRFAVLAALLWAGAAGAQSIGGGLSPAPASGNTLVNGRTLSAIVSDTVNILNAPYKAKCDGTTDDSAAITAAMATGKRVFIPSGLICNGATIAQNAITSMLIGPGQIKTSDGNLRGPITSQVSVRPSIGSSGVLSGFNGSMSGVPLAIEQRIGGTSLGQPTSSYLYTAETSAMIAYGYNSSGYVSATDGSGGRTGAGLVLLSPGQYGQGDYGAIWCNGVVASSKAGATTFFASPSVQCLEGQLTAGANGAYIEYLGDMDINDAGYDIAAIGTVMNFNRSNATENIGAWWIGDWRHNQGTKPLDAMYNASGPTVTGLDLSNMTMGYYRLAIVAVGNGGTGYVVGDTLTVTGGTSITPTVFTVKTIGANGSITALNNVNTGIYTATPVSGYGTLITSGGSGSGATITGAYTANNAILLPATGACIQPVGTTGTVNTLLAGYYGGLCLASGSLNWGQNNVVQSFSTATDVAMGLSVNLYGTNNFGFGQNVNDEGATGGGWFWANGTYSGNGAAQTSKRILRGAGTASMRLTTDGGAVSNTNSYPVVSGSGHNISMRVTAIDVSNSDTATWTAVVGTITRTAAGNATYTGQDTSATTPTYSTGAASTATLTVAADTTHQAISVTITPPTGTGHTWHAIAVLDADQAQ